MACEMCLAVLTAKDLVGVQVSVVDQPHPRRLAAVGQSCRENRMLKEMV